ncbi:hypothetical protein HZS_2114, partial [Henneguya salminicola]
MSGFFGNSAGGRRAKFNQSQGFTDFSRPKNLFFESNDFLISDTQEISRRRNIGPDEQFLSENSHNASKMDIDLDFNNIYSTDADYNGFLKDWGCSNEPHPLQNSNMLVPASINRNCMDIDDSFGNVQQDNPVMNNFLERKQMKDVYSRKFLKKVLDAVDKGQFNPNYQEVIINDGIMQFVYTLDGISFHPIGSYLYYNGVENNPGYREYVKHSINKIKLKNPRKYSGNHKNNRGRMNQRFNPMFQSRGMPEGRGRGMGRGG